MSLTSFPLVYEIAGQRRCYLATPGMNLVVGSGAGCEVRLEADDVREVEATLKILGECSVRLTIPGENDVEEVFPLHLNIGGYELIFFCLADMPEWRESSGGMKAGCEINISIDRLSPFRRRMESSSPLLLGSNAGCGAIVPGDECPIVAAALWWRGENRVFIKVLDNSAPVEWDNRGGLLESEAALPLKLSIAGISVSIDKTPDFEKNILPSSQVQPPSYPVPAPHPEPTRPSPLKNQVPSRKSTASLRLTFMTPQYHYLDASQQAIGPHSVEELEKLLLKGEITPKTLVAVEGGTEWVPFSRVRTAMRQASQSPEPECHDEFGYNDLLSRINRTFDRSLMGFYHRFPNLNREPMAALRRYLTQLNQWGLWGVVVAGGLGFLSMIYIAIKSDETMFFVWGVALLPATFVAQFLLGLITYANLKLTFGEPVPLASRLIPRTLALAATLALLAVFTYGGSALVELFDASFMAGLEYLVMWITVMSAVIYCGWLAARSEEVLGVQIRDHETQTAADYMFSVIRYIGRFFLALLPLLMAVSSGTLIVNLLIGLVRVISSSEGIDGGFVAFPFFRMVEGLSVFAFGAVLLPIVGHFGYVLLVASSEIGSAFFRLVENSRRIADAATGKDRTDN